MDRLIYIAMTGAKHTLERQATVANNMANASTIGFKGQVAVFRAVPVIGEGAGTRTFVVDTTMAADLRPGALTPTGRMLDVAVNGKGWIAVRGRDGREAYTRAGDLQLTATGLLQTRDGLDIVGDAGSIVAPPGSEVSIGGDGTVSVATTAATPDAVGAIGRIKLVNPPESELERGDDGLFRLSSGVPAPADPSVQLVAGTLERSNVSMVEALVELISQARHYETQLKLIQTADSDARSWSQILNMSA